MREKGGGSNKYEKEKGAKGKQGEGGRQQETTQVAAPRQAIMHTHTHTHTHSDDNNSSKRRDNSYRERGAAAKRRPPSLLACVLCSAVTCAGASGEKDLKTRSLRKRGGGGRKGRGGGGAESELRRGRVTMAAPSRDRSVCLQTSGDCDPSPQR